MLVGKPEGRRSLGIPRCSRVVNIKLDLGELGWGGTYCLHLAQDRERWRALVNTVMNFRFA
jgi:hypothetical protein